MKITFETDWAEMAYNLGDEATLEEVLDAVTAALQGLTYQLDGLDHWTYKRDYETTIGGYNGDV